MIAAPGADSYRSAILEQMPGVLSRIDRDPTSPSAGCCDRTFWAWKFTDFPGARFQEAVCVLAYVYANDFAGNPYFRNQNVLEWIELTLAYWSSIQHSDGSFDEAYPNERSFAATAFTTFYVGEALGFLGDDLRPMVAATTRESMQRASQWLTSNDETHGVLSNHLAAAVGALQHAHRQTDDASFHDRSAYFLDRILQHQSSEGWYEEYGGADFGYQTHGSFYLARVLELDPQPRLAQSLVRAVHFQGLFIHPDLSLGGEYASRNTQTYYPAAFEMLAANDHVAAWIATTMQPVISSAAAAGMRSVDAPNLFPMLNNLVFAFRACVRSGRTMAVPREPGAHDDFLWFRDAGIARIRKARYVAYVGTSNGGIVKVFDRRTHRLVYSDCGYSGRQRDGQRVTTQHFDRNRGADVGQERIELKSSFVRAARPVMNPWMFVAFRMFCLTLGRASAPARWLKKLLVDVLIYRKHPIAAELQRTIEFGASAVTIRDNFQGPGLAAIAELRWMPSFTSIHMGSSRYFVAHELTPPGFNTERAQRIEMREISGPLVLERTIRFA